MSDEKILVSMIAYREKQLGESVKDCYEKAARPENLIFSIVSEQSRDDLHADLSFIPKDQLIYRKYDLSEYRGVLWSREKTTDVNLDYDYVLFTCGHNLFVDSWDSKVLSEYAAATYQNDKVLITVAGPEYEIEPSWAVNLRSRAGRVSNYCRPKINSDYTPGYGFPEVTKVPDGFDVFEDYYLQFSWVFAPKSFVDEVPLDPDMSYHGEEIYVTVQAWCRGWRFYSTATIFYYHNTYKEYPDEQISRMITHRPWSDMNKDAFWAQSDDSMLKLNRLLSGKLEGRFGNISLESVLEFCKKSGLNSKWSEYNPMYDLLDKKRHADDFRPKQPIIVD